MCAVKRDINGKKLKNAEGDSLCESTGVQFHIKKNAAMILDSTVVHSIQDSLENVLYFVVQYSDSKKKEEKVWEWDISHLFAMRGHLSYVYHKSDGEIREI